MSKKLYILLLCSYVLISITVFLKKKIEQISQQKIDSEKHMRERERERERDKSIHRRYIYIYIYICMYVCVFVCVRVCDIYL